MKLPLFIILFISTINYSYTQNYIAIGGGINIAHTNFEGIGSTNLKPAIYSYFSIAPTVSLSSKLNVIFDLEYTAKGAKDETGGSIGGSKSRLSYLSISPELEYRLHKNIGIGLGVYAALRSREDIKTGDSDWVKLKDAHLIKASDYGLDFSLRADYKNIFFKIAYNLGLYNITALSFTDEDGLPIDGVSQKNRAIQIGVGYLLHL